MCYWGEETDQPEGNLKTLSLTVPPRTPPGCLRLIRPTPSIWVACVQGEKMVFKPSHPVCKCQIYLSLPLALPLKCPIIPPP